MSRTKGAILEEIVRAYFARQGFFALRGVDVRFENEKVTDIDVWLYGRQSANLRTRIVVDVKDKRSPRAFERILWTQGLKSALNCDRAVVATTDNNPKVVGFAKKQNVTLLHKSFLKSLRDKVDTSDRLTTEEFSEFICKYSDHKLDGGWLDRLADAKSSLVSVGGYPAFNKAIGALKFFGQRADTRPQYKEQATRGAYLSAGLACIALDGALEKVLYEDTSGRFRAITNGVTYGDDGDGKVKQSIDMVLEVISTGMENGRVVSRQASSTFEDLFQGIRADIIGEYFSCEHNASSLFYVGKELEERAHIADAQAVYELSTASKAILGVFADFAQINRNILLRAESRTQRSDVADLGPLNAEDEGVDTEKNEGSAPENGRLL